MEIDNHLNATRKSMTTFSLFQMFVSFIFKAFSFFGGKLVLEIFLVCTSSPSSSD